MLSILVDITFTDNTGKTSPVRFHARAGASQSAVEGFALSTAEALQAASSAQVTSIRIRYITTIEGGPEPGILSDVKRNAILFYRNGDDTASFYLSSPLPMLPEATGPYAGFRITRASVGVLNLLTMVDGLLSGALDPVGRPYGGYFSVGSFGGYTE